MKKYFTTDIGLPRALGFVEGLSLLVLLFAGVPMKYMLNNPFVVKTVGPVHGGLFLLYVFFIIKIAVDRDWSFRGITWKLLAGSILPFGTFYADAKILAPLQDAHQDDAA